VKDLAQDISKDMDVSQVQVRTVARGSKLLLITDSDSGRQYLSAIHSCI
jgi:hypothetical protein